MNKDDLIVSTVLSIIIVLTMLKDSFSQGIPDWKAITDKKEADVFVDWKKR